MEKIKDHNIGFLFDLDGVLIDSETEYTRIWSGIDRRHPTGVKDFAIVIKGKTLPEILAGYFPPELHPVIIDELNAEEQRMRYRLLPGADRMLSRLEREGIGHALVTSSNGMKMRHLREELPGFENRFDHIVTADLVKRSKPDPEGYLLGASLLGVEPRRCVVFEDSAQGVRAGHTAGAYVIGLSTTLPAEKIQDWCDEVVTSLADVDFDSLVTTLRSR